MALIFYPYRNRRVMMFSEEITESMIREKKLNAPRITPSHIDSRIVGEQFYVFESSATTICLLTLANGFAVTGESSAVSLDNYDVDIGRNIARDNARSKVWEFEGYLLSEKLANKSSIIEKISRAAHEVNRVYCQSIGDNTHLPWDDTPGWQKQSISAGVIAHYTDDIDPEVGHELWLEHKVRDGWTYGETKDVNKKTHPCMVPYEQLPNHQKAKDKIFRQVVHSLRESL